MRNISFLFVVLTAFISCDEAPSQLIIDNNSGMDIYCYPSNIYPDTSIDKISESRLKGFKEYTVLMFDKRELEGLAYCDETIWNSYVKNDTLLLFVFSKTLVDNTPFDTVIDKYMVHKKYEITYDELIANQCVVIVE
jgi:hypothetical protein